MVEKQVENSLWKFYREFFNENRVSVLLILAAGLIVRLIFVVYAPGFNTSGDTAFRYMPAALNLLAGNGFSVDSAPPFRPGEASVPLYPFFIAFIYSIFGQNGYAVLLAQVFFDLGTCLLIGFIGFQIAPQSLKRNAALFAMTLYGVFAWYVMQWTARLLTETLAVFLTTLLISLCVLGIENKKRAIFYWAGAGLVGGLAVLTRPDSVLLIGAVCLFLGLLAILRGFRQNTLRAAVFMLAVGLTILPWTYRNYVAFKKFQPLASEWGWARHEEFFMPTGYLLWIETWMTDETYFYHVFHQAFTPGEYAFEIEKIPDEIFDSEDEKLAVLSLMKQYNQTLFFTPEMDAEYRRIANLRIERDPVRYYLKIPLTRLGSFWLTGFAKGSNTKLLIRITSVLPIILPGFLGLIIFCRKTEIGWLLILVVAVRSLYLIYHYAPETRYIVEAYPSVVIAAGLVYARLFRVLKKS